MSDNKFMYGTLHSKFTKYDFDVLLTFGLIGAIFAGLLALPSIYDNPMVILYAAISGAFVFGAFFTALNRSGRRYNDPEEENWVTTMESNTEKKITRMRR